MLFVQCSQFQWNLYKWVRLIQLLFQSKIRWFTVEWTTLFFFPCRTAAEIMVIDDNPKAIHWHPENGYDETHANDTGKLYPHRSHGIGLMAGFRATLHILNQTTDFLCSGPILGFKVMIHRPDEIPQVSKNFFHVPANTDILITVKPNIFTTEARLIKYSPNQRQCFFTTEQKLRYFQHYNQRNCELECLANFTKSECGCIPFYMPSEFV